MKTLRSLLVASLLCPLGSLMLSGCAIDAGVDDDDVGQSEVAPELEANADQIVIGPILLSQIAYTTGGDIHAVKSDGSGDVLVLDNGDHPSYSQGRTRMAYEQSGAIKVVDAPFDAAAFAAAITVYQGSGTAAGETPVISADGTKVVFATAGTAGYSAEVYVATIGSGVPRLVVDAQSSWLFDPTFTAGGDFIAYTVGTPSINNGLAIRMVSTGTTNQPASTAGMLLVNGGYGPMFSPDGTMLAYSRIVAGRGLDIYVADSLGGNPVPFAGNSVEDDRSPVFSPGSGSLAFSSERSWVNCLGCPVQNSNHATNIWTGTLSGSSTKRMTGNTSTWTYVASPSWR